MQNSMVVLVHQPALGGMVARTLRGQQIYCRLAPFSASADEVLAGSPRGVILAAGHDETVAPDELDERLLHSGVPVLALGAAASALCERMGGSVKRTLPDTETVTLAFENVPLYESVSAGSRVLHDLRLLSLPLCLRCTATASGECIGFEHESLPLHAVQYAIERNDPDAVQLLTNFATLLCGAEPTWDESAIIDEAVEKLRAQIGESRALCAVSGGVDSAVCAKLAHMAVGDRLQCVFVDTGLFRQDEPESVIQSYMDSLGIVVAYVDARDAFLRALAGVQSAPDKERIIATLLRQVLRKQLENDPDVRVIVRGVNLNDTLYGGVEPMAQAPEGIAAAEPVAGLFKEEVRRLARALLLPDSIAEREPFPQSGLATRIAGEVTPEKLELLRAADGYFMEEIRAGGHERKLWQYYAMLADNPLGEGGCAVALRAVQAGQDGAHAARLPYDLLERVVERVRGELPQVRRVIYDLTPSAHYSTME